jgi:hypothetical protein
MAIVSLWNRVFWCASVGMPGGWSREICLGVGWRRNECMVSFSSSRRGTVVVVFRLLFGFWDLDVVEPDVLLSPLLMSISMSILVAIATRERKDERDKEVAGISDPACCSGAVLSVSRASIRSILCTI